MIIYPEAPVNWILLRCLIAGIAIGFFGTIVFVWTVFQLVKFKERKAGRSDLMVTSAWNIVFIFLGLGIGWEFLFPKPVLYLGPCVPWWAIPIGVPAGIAVEAWGASKIMYRLGDLGLTLCRMAIEG